MPEYANASAAVIVPAVSAALTLPAAATAAAVSAPITAAAAAPPIPPVAIVNATTAIIGKGSLPMASPTLPMP